MTDLGEKSIPSACPSSCLPYLTRPVSSLEDRTGSEGEAVRNVEVLWLRPVSLLSPLGDVPSSFPESSYK